MKKRNEIKSVEIVVDNLPEGTIGKKLSRLKDGITKREYAIGKIIMIDGREVCLIDIEGEVPVDGDNTIQHFDELDNGNYDVIFNFSI